jgi:hypothetical protein
MTSLPQTVPIINFIVEFLGSLPNQDVGQGQLEIDPLPSEMIHDTRLAVTIEAGYLAMGGGLPGFDILLHIVTEATEGRALRISKNSCKQN